MTDTVIRLHYRTASNKIEDAQQDFDLESFGGIVPSVGDMILDPGVAVGKDRNDRNNRRMLTVVQRVFNPRDNQNYIALIVTERKPNLDEDALI